jgi:hypothetical protein
MVIVMISLIFFGMMQVVLKLNAEQVQQWAAFRTARCRVVGFNDAFVDKGWHAANIIISGRMLAPQYEQSADSAAGDSQALSLLMRNRSDWQRSREMYMLGDSTTCGAYFLQPGTVGELEPWFNYEAWEHLPSVPPATTFDVYEANVQQSYGLTIAQLIPFLGASFGTTNATLKCNVRIENHFPLYLEVD